MVWHAVGVKSFPSEICSCAAAPLGSGAAWQVGSRGAGELGSWVVRELGSWGAGQQGSWGLGSWTAGHVADSSPEQGVMARQIGICSRVLGSWLCGCPLFWCAVRFSLTNQNLHTSGDTLCQVVNVVTDSAAATAHHWCGMFVN